MGIHTGQLPTLKRPNLEFPGITDAGMEFMEAFTRLRWNQPQSVRSPDTGLARRQESEERGWNGWMQGLPVTDGGLHPARETQNLKCGFVATGVTERLPRLRIFM